MVTVARAREPHCDASLLFEIASGALAEVELAPAWELRRAQRPDIDVATGVEVALLPAAWSRLKAAGIGDSDAARFDGLQRKALVSASLVLSELAAAQERLRALGIASAVGGGAAAILCGALSLGQRPLSFGEIWVSPRHLRTARSALSGPPGVGGSPQSMRQRLSGTCVVPQRRLILRSRIPSLPPMDARPLLGGTQSVRWQQMRFDVLRPTEVVFLGEVRQAASQAITRKARRGRARLVCTAEDALWQLDRAALSRLDGYSESRVAELVAATGWRVHR